ncbi:MBOAT_2 domain-containing protein [Cephalotus follicularis]|uniref:MBOAT_2 domain-containing protein n=1 Tax=Cephalotus follicularis TaxID=3775 RepID=A0A1Q3CQR3_CEPFO|nr:MBOAT_2 domain-containing protein [Cephalotus follicularis]
MDLEIKNFIKVWVIATISLCYCYYVASKIPRGMLRLLSLLPIMYIFIILPFNLSSVHFCGPTVFFLVWLANSKLLLFSFDQGPLSPPPPKLFHFISMACLPIKVKQDPPTEPLDSTPLYIEESQTKDYKVPYQNHTQTLQKSSPKIVPRSILFGINVMLLVLLFNTYNYKQYLNQNVVLALYCCHVYFELEIVLALCAIPARAIFGFQLEPQFNEPYLATSLQDFWGRRWNLMVTSILRPTVYYPTQRISTCIIGNKWAQLPAVIMVFVVSGLMHELIYYYLTHVHPTWEVTWFFVLHGVCTAIEIIVKKTLTDMWRLHRTVSGPLVVAFVAMTGVWLFFPQLLRNGVDEKAIREYSILVTIVKDNLPQHLL